MKKRKINFYLSLVAILDPFNNIYERIVLRMHYLSLSSAAFDASSNLLWAVDNLSSERSRSSSKSWIRRLRPAISDSHWINENKQKEIVENNRRTKYLKRDYLSIKIYRGWRGRSRSQWQLRSVQSSDIVRLFHYIT